MSPSATPNILDFAGLAALRREARANDPAAIKAAAQQFEALFLQQMLKAMRDATPQDGLFDSDQTRMYQSLLDQQLAQVMATRGNGMGLAAIIEKQMLRQGAEPQAYPDGLPLVPEARPMPLAPEPKAHAVPDSTRPAAPAAPAPGNTGSLPASGSDFLHRIWPHALEAGRATGIPARFVAAHAALESGWGRSEPRDAAGRPSYNLFGIKAGASWTGPVVEATTTEVVGGVAQKRVERFRAYGSYAEAFRDYASLLAGNPRYGAVLGSQDASAFARGLQRAGYATDPAYAAKLEKIITGPTLRHSLTA